MKHRIRNLWNLRLALAATLALGALGIVAPAPAGAAIPGEPDGGERAEWTQKFREAQTDVAEARRRHAKALAAYRSMRHRRDQRGVAKAEIVAELEAAEEALSDAERRLEDLSEVARRAGVPPGWIRAARESAPASPRR